MARMNVVLSDEMDRKLRRIAPRGRRSRLVEAALAAYIAERERREAFARVRKLSSSAPAVPMDTIVSDLRRDRRGR